MDVSIFRTLTCVLLAYLVRDAVSQCTSTPDSNGVHRFGTGCKYMCHCVNDAACDVDTGECTGGCAAGWFGPACQFLDSAIGLTSRHSDNTSPGKYAYLANDGDSNTCSYTNNISRTSTNPAFWRVSYTDNITFTELRIQTTDDKKAMYEGFTVGIEYVPVNLHLTKFSPGANMKTCYQHDGSTITSKVIYVSCDQPLQGNTAWVILATGKTLQLVICDFNVNGGRNLAFDKSASQSSVDGARIAGLAIDGSRSDSWNYCSVTTFEDNPWWQVNMGFIAYIQSFRITKYNDNNIRDYTVAVHEMGNWRQIYDDSQTAGVVTFVNKTEPIRAQSLQIQRNVNHRLVLCEVEVYGECIEDMCGLDCNIPCHCEVPVTMVTRLSGDCSGRSCTGRWTGQNGRCDTECTNTQWGPTCENPCGHCSSNEACDIVDGACPNGCQDGFHGSLCTEECGHCKDGPACRQSDGHCIEGCEAGYKPNNCVDLCDNGYYGMDCAHQCTQCQADQFRTCSPQDGKCFHGCVAGSSGQYCNISCVNTWGVNCRNDCGQCFDTTCNIYTGECNDGCKAGYKRTPMCKEECEDYTYGVRCVLNCSANCVDVCDKVTGTCSTCASGYTGPLCTAEIIEHTETRDVKESQSVVVPAVGGLLVGVAIILVVMAIGCIVYRKRFAGRQSDQTNVTKSQTSSGRQAKGCTTETGFTNASPNYEDLTADRGNPEEMPYSEIGQFSA